MISITVCIGSSCHIKGSHKVVEELKRMISERGLENTVSLGGTFCMGECQRGVCVELDGAIYSVCPETVKDFFETEVLARVKGC